MDAKSAFWHFHYQISDNYQMIQFLKVLTNPDYEGWKPSGRLVFPIFLLLHFHIFWEKLFLFYKQVQPYLLFCLHVKNCQYVSAEILSSKWSQDHKLQFLIILELDLFGSQKLFGCWKYFFWNQLLLLGSIKFSIHRQ